MWLCVWLLRERAIAFCMLWHFSTLFLTDYFSLPQGNHGEDVKELYYYLESTPTHSYMKGLYKYPQREFPYARLVNENRSRGKDQKVSFFFFLFFGGVESYSFVIMLWVLYVNVKFINCIRQVQTQTGIFILHISNYYFTGIWDIGQWRVWWQPLLGCHHRVCEKLSQWYV